MKCHNFIDWEELLTRCPGSNPTGDRLPPIACRSLLRELACSADQNKQAVQALQAVFTKVHNSLHVILVTFNSRPYDDLLRHPGCESDCTIFHLGNLSLATRRQPPCKGCIWFGWLHCEQETTLRAGENVHAVMGENHYKFQHKNGLMLRTGQRYASSHQGINRLLKGQWMTKSAKEWPEVPMNG